MLKDGSGDMHSTDHAHHDAPVDEANSCSTDDQ